MTVQTEAVAATPSFSMSIFERYLTVWVLLCIVAGIALGQLAQRRQWKGQRVIAIVGLAG